ncbi:IQ motif containing E [Rhinolophus ferrumequinum]|uniref:IQ motif containing E n=1 Tax=Rhinolophus ferrumequinum TaxID=59479 RepID=A0A7J7RXG2_RHIFE|nr:IQ motif containing E [Rhinolophus ferrumequinum]
MSLGTGDAASDTGDDSLSVVTFDSDVETKAKRKSFHKPLPTSPKSPYHSKPRKVASWRSLKAAASVPLGNRMSLTPQKLWLGSSKQGSLTQPPRSDLTLERAWTNPHSSTPDYLAEALRTKRSNLRRSASNGHVPGTPVYREKEDMYDEIIELKKSLHMQKRDADLLRTKLRRLEEENSRKDRQIEQLLDQSRGPEFVRTLAEKRPDTGWVVNGLKQRVLKLEQQCKDKDSSIHKLQTDLKTTNLEEMRIAMETCYEEIHRLQTLLASSEVTGRKPPMEKKSGLKRQKKMSSALLSLSRSVQELTEENRTLKEDLDRVLSNSPTVARTKGYTEWSKPRLLRRIAELEKKISSMESPRSHASEVDRSDPLGHSASSSVVHRQPQSECQEDSECLRGAVRSLKGEQKALQVQLQERDLEVKQLLQAKADLQKELEDVKEGEKARREREEALREEIQTLTKKFQELEEIKKEEDSDLVEVSPEETKAVLDEAATVLQAAFRGHRARVKLLSSKVCGSESASVPSLPSQLQSCPSPCLLSPIVQAEGDPGHEEAITIIQSIFRAHLARIRHRATGQRTPSADPARRRSAPAAHSEPSSPPLPAASAKPPPSGLQPMVSPHAEDVNSDDSDEIVAPSLPVKRNAPPSLGRYGCGSCADGLSGEA